MKFLLSFFLCFSLWNAFGEEGKNLQASPLSQKRISEIAAMLPVTPAACGPSIENRTEWDKLKPKAEGLLAEADSLAQQRIPELPDDLFLEFSRKGTRPAYEKLYSLRSYRLAVFTLAECVTNQGKYLQAISRELEAILSEKTWVLPVHDPELKNFRGSLVDVDLGAAMRAGTIATAMSWLGDKLPAELKQKASAEINRRVFDPYRERIRTGTGPCSWFVEQEHNWNAVCHAGIVLAALAVLPDARDRAEIVAGAEYYTQNYLKGFTPDGYCKEGLGYWNYGFGHYVVLAEALYRATQGKLNLYRPSIIEKVALFPEKYRLSDSIYPSFADCMPGDLPEAWIVALCSRRFDFGKASYNFSELRASKHPLGARLYEDSIRCFSCPEFTVSAEPVTNDPLRGWFPDAGVLLARPLPETPVGMAVAMKGGVNIGGHHHNDLGSFIVAFQGRTPLCDPGMEPYSALTFGPHRYENEVINSFGHSVPVVAGQLQSTGDSAKATIVDSSFSDGEDRLTYDLAPAYKVPSLMELKRTFAYSRKAEGSLTVQDTVRFSQPESFSSAFITRGTVTMESPDTFIVKDGPASLRVKVSTDNHPFTISQRLLKTALLIPPTRIAVEIEGPVTCATLVYQITALVNDNAGRNNLSENKGIGQKRGEEAPALGGGTNNEHSIR